MAAPQGLFSFGGIRGLCSASMTLTLGTVPNLATMYVAPQNLSTLPANGTLSISFDGGGIEFPDCHLEEVNFEVRRDGFEVWALSIADCRWRWRYPIINGEFNIRMDDQKIHQATVKSARDIAKLLMEAIRFPRADISKVPKDVFPEIHWEYTRVDRAIPELLDPLGLRMRLLPGNLVSIVEVGKGAALPPRGRISGGITIKPPERPDSLVFVAGRSQWQHDFPLWAIGRDIDGSWKRIDELSYRPRVGWDYFDQGLAHQIDDPVALRLAQETVFRWYTPKFPVTLPVSADPRQNVVVKDPWRILPMGERQLVKAKFVDGLGVKRQETLPPWIYGKYSPGGASAKNNTERLAELKGDVETYPHTLYTGNFNFHSDTGLVVFEDPVFMYEDAPGPSIGRLVREPSLYLRTSCPLRDEQTRQFYHYKIERRLPGRRLGTAPKYIVRDDICAKALSVWFNGALHGIGNLPDIEKYAKFYLDAEEKALQIDAPEKAAYPGFQNIFTDGAIQQVTWQVSEQGFATTVAARNNEIRIYAPTYEENRVNQRLGLFAAAEEAREQRERRRGLR